MHIIGHPRDRGEHIRIPAIQTSFTFMKKPILPLGLGLSLVLAFTSGISDLRAEGTTSTQRPMTYTLTGVVVDSSGSPLVGAAVRAAGMKTSTDGEGRFILHLASRPSPSGVTVRVSYLGMKTREVVYRGQALHITLSEDTQQIGEVVITARPNINALDLRSRSGVVAEVDMKQLQQKPMIDLALALQGSVPGLTVISRGELGEKPEIRIRGNNSFVKGDLANEPLYVLDGKIISPQAFMTLNPLDIREIKVLKDAVATALYGIKAANGVLEISSRRGATGPMSISLSSSLGVTLRGRQTTTMMQTEEKLEIERRMDSLRRIETDWWKLLIRPNTYQSHNLSLRGGSKEVTYYVSGNFTRQGGQLEGNDTKRFALANSLDWQNKIGFISLGLSGGYAKTNSPNSSNYSPQQLVYDLNPYESKNSPILFSHLGRRYQDLTNQFRRWSKEVRLGSSLSANLRPLQGLQLDAILGIDYVLSESEQITPATAYDEVTRRKPTERGVITVGKNTDFNYSANLRATYTKVFADKHDLSISANTDYYYNEGRILSVTGHGIGRQEYLAGVNKALTSPDLRPDFSGTNSTSAQLGFGLALGYTYDSWIDLFAAYKADASSLLPRDKRWNTAWALGGGLHLTHLIPLLREGKVISGLNLKASLGLTASLGGITSASAVPIFSYQQSSFYAEQYRLIRLSAMYNERLKAEQLKSIDLGLGIQIAGAHSLDLNLYRRDTRDALLEREIPSSNGFSSMLDNVGSLRNEGIELSASSRILNSGDWRLSLRASLAYNRSKVLDLYGKQVIYTNSDNIIPDYEVGKPYDYIYGLDALGVNPLRGELMFRDQKGQEQPFSKEIKREDLSPLGFRTPPYTGSLSLSLGYGALELDAQLYYVFGGIKSYSMTYVRGVEGINRNAIRGQLDRTWFTPGDVDKLYPSPQSGTQTYNNLSSYPNTRMIAKSDYLRLSMLSLRYRLPARLLAQTSGIVKYASVALQGSNLFTLSPYKGGSPESGTYDLSVQPVISLNLNLSF